MIYDSIPEEMRAQPQWICWGADGAALKCPYDPNTGKPAKAGHPNTWAWYEMACDGVARGYYRGIGFEFADDGGVIGVDFDHCLKDGQLDPNVSAWVERFNSYTEVSQSGEGIHIFCKGHLPGGAIKTPTAEMYDRGRYFAMTGNTYGPARLLHDAQDTINELYSELAATRQKPEDKPTSTLQAGLTLDDEKLLGIAGNAKNSDLFLLLFAGDWTTRYKSQSEADIALCNILAFYTGRNAAQMDRLFRQSALFRPKWDRPQSGSTYGALTIENAIQHCTQIFDPCTTAEQAFNSFEGFEGQGTIAEIDGKTVTFAPFAPFAPPSISKLPVFSVECLPPAVRDYVKTVAENLQVSVDMPAVAALAVISLCVQGKFIINPKPGWLEPLNLYTVIVAKPSDRKSPMLKTMTRRVYEFTREENERRAPEINEYRTKRNILAKAVNSMTERAAKGDGKVSVEQVVEKQQELSELEKDPVKPLRLLADDATPEALTRLIAENGGKMAVVSSEGGLFDMAAGRYNDKVNIDVLLKAYSGDPVTVDRIGRDGEYIEHPALTMLLTIQPAVLASVMEEQTFRGRGFVARFLYALPVSAVGGRHYMSAPIPQEIEAAYTGLLETLLTLPGEGAASILHLTHAAHMESMAFADALEPRLIGDLEDIEDWAGKYHGQIMRIAGLLHCCKYGETASDTPVDWATIRDAQQIGEYFLAHARAAYQIMGMSDNQAAKDAKYILRRLESTGQTEISKRDLHQLCKDKTGLEKASNMDAGLDVLIERGYISVIKVRPQNPQNPQNPKTGGRPTEKVYFNPEYLTQKAQKAQNSMKEVS